MEEGLGSDGGQVLEGDVEREILSVEVERELIEALIRQRQKTYRLLREIDDLRRDRVAVKAATRHRKNVRAALAAVTWADDIEEAHEIAARALREEFSAHDGPPPSVSEAGGEAP